MGSILYPGTYQDYYIISSLADASPYPISTHYPLDNYLRRQIVAAAFDNPPITCHLARHDHRLFRIMAQDHSYSEPKDLATQSLQRHLVLALRNWLSDWRLFEIAFRPSRGLSFTFANRPTRQIRTFWSGHDLPSHRFVLHANVHGLPVRITHYNLYGVGQISNYFTEYWPTFKRQILYSSQYYLPPAIEDSPR